VYLDLLIAIALSYIQAQAVESLSKAFYINNAAINAQACEFLELLMKDTNNGNHLIYIIDAIIEPVMLILRHSFVNKD